MKDDSLTLFLLDRTPNLPLCYFTLTYAKQFFKDETDTVYLLV